MKPAAVLDASAIHAFLPHRYPFLFVDQVIELVPGSRIVGVKNVSLAEPYFQGHFPGRPVMPGVLIIEAMAQTGGILALYGEEEKRGKLCYFTGIDHARFRAPVLPGDRLELIITMRKQRRDFWWFDGEARVGDQLCAEAGLSAMVTKDTLPSFGAERS